MRFCTILCSSSDIASASSLRCKNFGCADWGPKLSIAGQVWSESWFAVFIPNANSAMWSSQFLCDSSTYCRIIVLMVRFTSSSAFGWGWYGGAFVWFTCLSSRKLSIALFRNRGPSSEKNTLGVPSRRKTRSFKCLMMVWPFDFCMGILDPFS